MPSALDLLSAAALLDQPTQDSIVAAAAAAAAAAAPPASPTVNDSDTAAPPPGLFAHAQEQPHHVPASAVAAARAHQLGDIARAVINSGSGAGSGVAANQGQGRQRVPSSSGSTGLFAQVLPHPPPPPVVSLPPLPPPPVSQGQQHHSHGTRRQAREQQQQQLRLHFYTAPDGTAQLASPAAATGLPPLPALPLPSTLPPLPSLPRSTASISPLPSYAGVIPAQQQPQQPPPPPARKPPPPPYAVPAESGLIRCVCPYTVDDGFTIQCDLCNVWQHAACVGIPSLTDVPDEYCCERCDPVGARERGVDGRLAEVGMRVRMREMERVQEQIKRAEALQALHHKDWLERQAAAAAAREHEDVAPGAGGHQRQHVMTEKARSHAAAAAVDDDPDFTLHGSSTTPRSRPRATKPRRSGGGGTTTMTSAVTAAASALAGVTSSPPPQQQQQQAATTTTTKHPSREEPAASPSLSSTEAATEMRATGAELSKQKHEESDVEMVMMAAADSLPETTRADQQQHVVSTLAAAAAAETVPAPVPASVVVPPAAALPTLPPPPAAAAAAVSTTKTPVPIGRKRRVAKQPKSRATSTVGGGGGGGGGGDGTDDGASAVTLALPTEPSDGGARLSSLRDRDRAAKNASASASAYDDSGLSSSGDERTGSSMTMTAAAAAAVAGGGAATTSSSRGGDRQARHATVDDEDRYDSWQYEFTPIDSNLYPDVALLDHLEHVLSKPPVSPLDEIDGAQHPHWQSLRERQDATRGMASGRTSAKLVEAVYDLQPAYVDLPTLPPPAPIAVKPLPLSATNIAQPPVQAAYIPTPYSASLHASSAAAQAMCPYPRPKSFALFATAPIAAGSYITDFKGEIVDLAQYRSDPINQYPLVGAPKGAVRALPHPWSLVVDARRWGNEARFARSGCKPNAILRVVKTDANPLTTTTTTTTTTTSQAQDQAQKRRGKPKARSRSTTPFPGGGGTGDPGNAGRGGTAQWSAQRLEHPVAGTFHVAIFALTDIHKRDEIILPWDWDDAHLVHLLPSLLALPSPSASPSLLQSLANHLDAAANLSRSMALVADVLLAPASSSLNGGCACDRKRDCAVWWLARGGAASCFSLTAKGGGGRATDDVGIAFLNAFAGANGRDKEGVDPSVAKRKAGGGGANARQVDLGALVGLERGWLIHEPEKAREAVAELESAAEDGVESGTEEAVAADPDAMAIDPKPAAAAHLQVTPSAGVDISPSSALTSLPSDDPPVVEVAAKAARPPKEVLPSATDAAHDSDSSELTEPLSNLSALEDDDDDDDLSEPDDSVLSPPLPSKVKELSRDVSPQPLPPPKKRKAAAKKPSSRAGKSSAAPSSKSKEDAPKVSSPAPSKPKQDKAKKEAKDSKKRKVARVYSSSESESEPVSQDSSRAASRALSPPRESSEETRHSSTPAVPPPPSGSQANRPKKRPASSTPSGLAALKIRKVKKHSRRIDSDESEEETRSAKSPLVEVAQKTDVGGDDVKMNSDEAVTRPAVSTSAAAAETIPDATMTSVEEAAKSESPAAQPVDQPAQPPPVRARLSFAEYRQRQMNTPGRPIPPPPPPPPPPLPQPLSVTPAGVSTVSSVEAKAPAPVPPPPPPPPPAPPPREQTPVAHPLAGVTAAQLEALAGALAAASSSPSFTPTMSLTSLSGPSPSPSALSLGLVSETPPIRPSVFLRPPPPRPPPPPPPPPPASALAGGHLGPSPEPSSLQASGASAVPGGDGDEPEAGTPPLPPLRGLAAPPTEPLPAAETPESGKLSAADILKSIGDYFGSASATPSSAKPARQLAPDALAATNSPSAVSQGTPPLPPPRTPFSGASVASELPAAWPEPSSTASRGPPAQNRRSSFSQTGSALGLHSTSLPSFSSSAAAVSAMQPPSGPRASGPSPLPGFRPISSQSPVSASGFLPSYPRASQSPYGKPALLQKSPAGAFSRAPLPSVTPARQASISPAMGSNMSLYAGGSVRPSPPVRPVELGGSIPTGPKAMQTGLVPAANAGRPSNAGTASPATPTTPAQNLPSRGGWGPAGRGRGGGGFGGGPPSGPRHPGSGPPPRGRGGWGWRGRGGGRG